jgi:hypothetical protein
MVNKARRNSYYRYSDRFIAITTRVLIGILIVGVGGGFLVGALSGATYKLRWLGNVATPLVIGGMAIPILGGAFLGGESLMRFGGFVGLALIAGLVAAAIGFAVGPVLLGIAGAVVAVLSVVGFYLMGFKANVPVTSVASSSTRVGRDRKSPMGRSCSSSTSVPAS